MAKTSKAIVGILGSDSISWVDLNRFVDKDACGQVVCGGLNCVDTLAEEWAKKHNKEFVAYLPNYKLFGHERGPKIRDQEIAESVDKILFFWDNIDSRGKEVAAYADFLGVPYRIHVIEER